MTPRGPSFGPGPVPVLCLLPSLLRAQETPPVAVELEAGPAWQTRNDVQIPNDSSGTRFSLQTLVGSGPWPAGRIYVTWNLSEQHGVRAMATHLSFTERGKLDRPVDFAGRS